MFRTLSALVAIGLCGAAVCAAAPSAQVKLGHLCCAGCVGPAEAAVKSLPWVESVKSTTGSPGTMEVTAKSGSAVDMKALSTKLTQAGFAPGDVRVKSDDGTVVQLAAAAGPEITLMAAPGTTVTATVGHLCCGGCAGAVKGAATKLPFVEKADVDQAARTITITPKAGEYSLSALLSALESAGFKPLKLAITTGQQQAKASTGRVARR